MSAEETKSTGCGCGGKCGCSGKHAKGNQPGSEHKRRGKIGVTTDGREELQVSSAPATSPSK